MKKLSINLSLLTSSNLITLGLLLAETSMKSGSESIKNSPIIATLLTVAKQLFDAINRESYSKLSPKVKDLDKRRDGVYIGVRTYVTSMLYSIDETIVAAATRIEQVLDKHGVGIEKKHYLEESTLLRKLLADLKAPELAADILKIGLTRQLAELETAMNDFDAVFNERTVDEVSIKEQLSVTAQRRELEEAIRNFIGYANYTALADPNWANLIKLLEPDVTRIKATINKPDTPTDTDDTKK
jgi:uncharacterized protein Yka (UPF0111/DUF47 family)